MNTNSTNKSTKRTGWLKAGIIAGSIAALSGGYLGYKHLESEPSKHLYSYEVPGTQIPYGKWLYIDQADYVDKLNLYGDDIPDEITFHAYFESKDGRKERYLIKLSGQSRKEIAKILNNFRNNRTNRIKIKRGAARELRYNPEFGTLRNPVTARKTESYLEIYAEPDYIQVGKLGSFTFQDFSPPGKIATIKPGKIEWRATEFSQLQKEIERVERKVNSLRRPAVSLPNIIKEVQLLKKLYTGVRTKLKGLENLYPELQKALKKYGQKITALEQYTDEIASVFNQHTHKRHFPKVWKTEVKPKLSRPYKSNH